MAIISGVVLYCDDTWGNTIYTKHISYLYSQAKKVRVDRITAFIVDDDEEEETQIQSIVSLLSTMKCKIQILAPI